MKINLNESLTGFKRTVQHLDGRFVLIQHPPNQPIIPSLFILFITKANKHFLLTRFNETNPKSRDD
jgi:hypothetical protein